MEIVYKSVNDLIPYVNNTRTHSDDQVMQIASSIKEFGFTNPVLIDDRGGIIAGHGRIMAAKKLKLKEVPCIVLSGLTEAQKKAYIIADNKLALNAGWDEELLKVEIENLKELDFNIELLGFSDSELDLMFKDDNEVEEDDFEMELPDEPKSKRGDIWLLGRHRLMCGDSTGEDVNTLMDGKKANMCFTDPPYGYEYQSNMRTKSEKFEVLKNDDKLLDFMPKLKEFVSGFVFICASWKNIDEWVPLFRQFFDLSNMIIWDKGGGGIGDLKKTFSTDYEIILTSHNNAEITGKRIGSVWDVKKDSANDYIHATQKPVGLSALAIKNTTLSNSIVLDVFGGSGSTLIASEQLNRICYMMELDEKYVDVIIHRYKEFVNSEDEIVLLRDGKEFKYSDIFKEV